MFTAFFFKAFSNSVAHIPIKRSSIEAAMRSEIPSCALFGLIAEPKMDNRGKSRVVPSLVQ